MDLGRTFFDIFRNIFCLLKEIEFVQLLNSMLQCIAIYFYSTLGTKKLLLNGFLWWIIAFKTFFYFVYQKHMRQSYCISLKAFLSVQSFLVVRDNVCIVHI